MAQLADLRRLTCLCGNDFLGGPGEVLCSFCTAEPDRLRRFKPRGRRIKPDAQVRTVARRGYMRAYYEAHKERYRERHALWRALNRELYNRLLRKWRERRREG